jgi:hypothetical protein
VNAVLGDIKPLTQLEKPPSGQVLRGMIWNVTARAFLARFVVSRVPLQARGRSPTARQSGLTLLTHGTRF